MLAVGTPEVVGNPGVGDSPGVEGLAGPGGKGTEHQVRSHTRAWSAEQLSRDLLRQTSTEIAIKH